MFKLEHATNVKLLMIPGGLLQYLYHPKTNHLYGAIAIFLWDAINRSVP